MAKNEHQIKPIEGNIDFPARERELLDHWYRDGIVEKYLHKNDDSTKKFFFQDGPITANNPMGVHHAWGRTYKDLWQRYHNMRGFKQRFQNGFDCQGLWVEVEVEKDLQFHTKKDIENFGVANFVEKCKERVLKYSAIQTEQSKRLGYFMDWDNSYFTMSDENNYTIWHFLNVCHEKGWIYQGNDAVPWCPRCETPISQHEMLTEDYKELTHKAVYFKLPLTDHQGESLLVWTTTPWTIPANIAVAVSADLEYSLVKVGDDQLWVAKDRVEAVLTGTEYQVVKTIKGSELEGLKYAGPFDSLSAVLKVAGNPLFHTVVKTDPLILPITATEGTGLVHTAVSAGVEDFQLGKKLGLPFIPVIADNADYLEGLDFLSGLNAKKHPEIILDFLQQHGFVFKAENYTHRYPACWRCKSELVWKIADVWYIAMDKVDPTDDQKPTLRQKMIDVAKAISWMPEFGLSRELDWLNNMHDWLISKKNRYWGLALPFWICDDCHEFEVIDGKDDLKERAVEGWSDFEGHSPHRPFIDLVKIKCSKCGGTMTRTTDVGNPWLDAGIVPYSTLHYATDHKYWEQWFPADFITESFPGQFKNWFYSMIAMSTVLEDRPPFLKVLGYASLLAENGKPMHKSDGTSIEFSEGADKMGSDVMRWIYARQNPERNLLFGYKVAEETKRQFHMMLWNSYKFFANYAALENWQPVVEFADAPSVLDQWILNRLDQTVITVTQSLDQFDAFSASASIDGFVNDLSTWYIRRSRDRVGPSAVDLKDKEVCYRTFRTVFDVLSRILMPFTPFISDQIYTNLTGEDSVHLADWPEVATPTVIDTALIDQMTLVRRICELGNGARKEQGIAVKQPLNKLIVHGKTQGIDSENQLIQLIMDELNVENVDFHDTDSDEITVELDTILNDHLIAKGRLRELVRSIQEARKEAGCSLDEVIDLEIPDYPSEFEAELKRQTLVGQLRTGQSLRVIRNG